MNCLIAALAEGIPAPNTPPIRAACIDCWSLSRRGVSLPVKASVTKVWINSSSPSSAASETVSIPSLLAAAARVIPSLVKVSETPLAIAEDRSVFEISRTAFFPAAAVTALRSCPAVAPLNRTFSIPPRPTIEKAVVIIPVVAPAISAAPRAWSCFSSADRLSGREL